MKKNIFIVLLLFNIFILTNISYANDEYEIGYFNIEKAFNIQNNTYNISNYSKFNSLKEKELPSCYNSLDKGYITSVKDQDPYGTCWSFATMAAIESSLIKNNKVNKNINLSESQLIYFSYNKPYDPLNLINCDYNKITNGENYLKAGGNYYLSMFSLATGYGVINENKMKYSSLKSNSKYNSNLAFNNDYTVKNNYLIPMSQVDNIKKCIIEYGSVASAYYHDKRYLNKKTNAFYQTQKNFTNHAITIVGWSDNYPKENFLFKPKNNGAWLIKNSWGKDWGYGGYFWISYEDESIKNTFAACYEMNNINKKFLNRYQYDGTASTSYIKTPTYYQSNIYTAQTNELLSDIGFFTDEENLSYEISIYKDVQDIPTDGTLINTYNGSTTFTGYYSVELPEKIILNKNDKFSIVIKLSDRMDLPSYLLVDSNSKWGDWIKFINYSNPGESFISQDNENWIDIGIKLNANCRIKALTVPISTLSINKTQPQKINTKITLNNINNGIENVEYKFLLYNKTYKTKQILDYSNDNVYTWTPTKKGIYDIYGYTKDLDTNKEYVTKKSINISDLNIKKISYSKSKTKNGYHITIKPQISGGYGIKQFKYVIKNSKGKIIVNKNYSKNNYYKPLFKTKDTYTIICYTKDTLGYECYKSIKVKI